MRILSLEVRNFRAIRYLLLSNLEQMVLIAGPNGCGKSCIFDAIRLLKSCYGGYQPNEWQMLFGEYQINIGRQNTDISHLFRESDKPIVVVAHFELSEREKAYLGASLGTLAREAAWDIVAPHTQGYGVRPVARDVRTYTPEVEKQATEIDASVRAELGKSVHEGRVEITQDELIPRDNPLLELVFGRYDPRNLGIIDYHGANRSYNREQVGGINLTLDGDDHRRQHALYNTQSKYSNIKSEMAAGYVRELIARESGIELAPGAQLTETLQELFQTFFPGKTFAGPRATKSGGIEFPVSVDGGAAHDINDLSSGEKEVLFGYLRLRNASPRDSVILLDEPEMHLNPGLIKGLPQFYRRHVGQALQNQVWLVTHSDAFLREASGQPGFSVFHMHPASSAGKPSDANQVALIEAREELELAIIDLMGELAMYRPDARVVFFEGENSEFDLRMTTRLFPRIAEQANLVSAGSKTNVHKIHDLLQRASGASLLGPKYFSIVDGDSGPLEPDVSHMRLVWPVYHIENFLLEPRYLLNVMRDLSVTEARFGDNDEVQAALLSAAREVLTEHLRHRVQSHANRLALERLSIRADRTTPQVGSTIAASYRRTLERLEELAIGPLSESALAAFEEEARAELTVALEDGSWAAKFPGRSILRRFVGQLGTGLSYVTVRDLIVAKMRDDGFEPEGMRMVLARIFE